MTTELQNAIANANKEIELNKVQGLTMTNYFIRRNIELVSNNPNQFEKDFIKIYNN